MSYALNNATTQDDHVASCTLKCPGTVRLNVDVANAACYVQLGRGQLGVVWDPEVFFTPSFRALDRSCDALRVRSAKAGKPAQVTVTALARDDL